MAKKSWFSAKANGKSSGEVVIYNDIGFWGVTAQDFYDALKALGPVDDLSVRISSDGGEVPVGFAIANMLARHKAYKVVTVDGLAASMASVIAMTGDEVVMPENSFLMIHNPWSGVMGDAAYMRSTADVLDKMTVNIRDAYIKRTGLKAAKVTEMMDAETWLTADEAVELGFADRVDDPVDVAAQKFNLAKFGKVPELFGAHSKGKKTMTTKKNAAANSGDDNNANEDVAAKTREEIVAEAKEIRALCKLAGKAELADKFIEDGKSVSDVVAELSKLSDEKSEKEEKETTTNARHTTTNDGQKTQAKAVDTTDIYARFNKKPTR
ncbi:head maturation protease, ClpP-related [Bradyrhizobium sp. Ec3.3]|uniref:head maturation protease, ClpP-related n=1 Tax=Bradyrhizobium sp. Ec3.3 TaxID=189753 RepID=UPI0003FEDA97|nr:head maturation protease, ClpP-related [Bradyrhizobium sp. Ec3.3]